MMAKIKASFIHLLISIIVVGSLILLVFFLWYPKPLFEISGVITPLKMLVLIDVIVGPMLTFLVYKKHKKTLKMDLSIIALIQLLALGYGAYTIYNGRPSLIVMSGGELQYMVEKYAYNDELKNEELKPHFFSAPQIAYSSLTKSTVNDKDFYASIIPVDHYNDLILPFTLSELNMKARYPSKSEDIDTLLKTHKNEEIVFLLLNKDLEKYYVLYSVKKNRIIDHLSF